MYTEKVIDHFNNPRNVGKMENANVVVQVGDPDCGDAVLYFLRIEDDVVRDVKFLVKGCGAAIATSSISTELVMGKKLEDVLQLTDQSIADALGGLPPEKMHCSNMATRALHAAVTQYRARVDASTAECAAN